MAVLGTWHHFDVCFRALWIKTLVSVHVGIRKEDIIAWRRPGRIVVLQFNLKVALVSTQKSVK